MTRDSDFSEPSMWRGTGSIIAYPRRLVNRLFQHWARYSLWVTPRIRARLQAWRGVHFEDPGRVFIGDNVMFDGVRPDLIHIGCNVIITDGTKILAHFYDPSFEEHCMRVGHVHIEDDVFIGMNVVIAAPVHIGRGAVIGAGAMVIDDVPPDCVVGGVPARPIGERGSAPLPEALKGAWRS